MWLSLTHLYILFFLIGIAVGSFLNAWIWRMSVGKSVAKGRSICPQCAHQLAWYDNIPIVSFLLLRGKCRYCHKSISWQYPLVELLTGFLFTWAFFVAEKTEEFLLVSGVLIRDWVIISLLIVIFVFDLRYQEIWDRTTLIPSALLFLCALIFDWRSAEDMLIGAIIVAGFFLLQFMLSKGKWIGGGDVRLGVLMGVILGWKLSLVALFLAYVGGALWSIGLMLAGKLKLASHTAFGTYLTIATFVTMYWGEDLLGWYLGMVMF